jgi:hypothetical protein
MAAPRAPRRIALLAATVLGALLFPTGVARAAGLTLQVSPEVLTADANNSAVLTPTVAPAPSNDTVVNFEAMNGPARTAGHTPGNPDTTCTVKKNTTTCSATITSTEAGTSLVRAWIEGTAPDMTEARLANNNSTLTDLPAPLGDPSADCRPVDPSSCHDGSTPNAGDVAEPDATDVVQVTFLNFTDGRLDCTDHRGGDVLYKNATTDPPEETYTCSLSDSAGDPIPGAFIDAKILPKMKTAGTDGTADFNDVCQTGSDGRCDTGAKISLQNGAEVICFWAEPAKQGAQTPQGKDNAYHPGQAHTDGGDCGQVSVTQTADKDVTDVVYLDSADPRPEGLDVQPETSLVSGATSFSLRGTVFDQFGNPYTKGGVKLQAKLFQGSVLAGSADNSLTTLDPNLTCSTGPGDAACAIFTAAQNDLGTNLACVWLDTKKPVAMVGQGDQESATCKGPPAPWQDQADEEAHVDATADDGTPSPPTDGLDVVRFAVQSRPKIATVTPDSRRQDTSGDVLGVDGINFLPSALITISGTGVTLGPTAVVSDKRLEASLAVAPGAPPGARDIVVTNRSDGGSATCSGCFRVIGQGYWMVASDGGVFSFGDARFVGSAGSQSLNKPIVAMTPTPSGLGYWMVSSDGGLFAFGDAPFVGSAGSVPLTKPIVSMAATPSGRGYWMVASDGGVFGYGDAKFYGALSKLTLSKPIVSIVASPSGRGYWLLASDGGIFAFGDAKFFGSTGDLLLNKPIVSMAPTKTGKGYWLVGTDGGIFAYGDATFYGSTGAIPLNKPIVGMTTTPFGKGYWMVASDGGIFSFGDAQFLGSTGSVPLNKPIVGLARR